MGSQETSALLKGDEEPTFSKKRKGDHKLAILALAALLICFVIITIVLAVLLGARIADEENSTKCGSTCTTSTCLEATSFLIQGLDQSVDPCEDFYKYSCGNWEANNVIPEGFGRYSTFNELGTSNSITLKKALEEPVPEGDDGSVSKARYMYTQCMDLDAINKRGAEPLIEIVKENGGWALIGVEETEPNWTLEDSLYREHYYGSDAIFSFSIEPDDFNSSKVVIKFTQSGITLPSSTYYDDDKYANITEPYMKSILLLLGAEDGGDLDAAIDEIYEIERILAEKFYSATELRNVSLTYNVMTIDDFIGNYTSFEWLVDYLNGYFELAGSYVEFAGDESIVIGPLGYFEEVNEELIPGEYEVEAYKNYAKWSLVKHYIRLMGKDFLDAYYTFNTAVTGSGEIQRYLTCVELVQFALPMAVARPFVDKYFTNKSIQEIGDIITAIRTTFKQRLDTKEWLDEETKERCRVKVDSVSQSIAYPEFIKDDEKLNELYAKVFIIKDTNLFDAYLEVLHFSRNDTISQYGKPTDKEKWYYPPTLVNAYYSPSFNQFVFLAGILRHPFFETGWPSYLSYGALGVVVGHELTHGFDDQGQQYDANGNRRPWWTEASQKAFQERTKCFEDQYSEYTLDDQKVNGSLTLGENIADNGGVHTAFQAYKTHANDALTLPGTNLTNDQLFFVAFGQVWCTLYTPEFLQLQVITDPHSPGPIRVLGSLSNSQEFADAFNCPAGSRMNPPPEEKCQLW